MSDDQGRAQSEVRAQAAREFPFVDGVGWPDGYEERVVELTREARVRVDCDDDCGALEEPTTLEEYRAALEHWRNHPLYSGCSHGC